MLDLQSSSQSPPESRKLRYITAETASQIDEALMSSEGGFSIDQLMELAGLSCAQALHACYPPDAFNNVLVAAGPGNQGGDGLVAARHLTHFGYNLVLWYPKEGKTELFSRLKKQLSNLNVSFAAADEFIDALEGADVVLDAIFGFSFKGEPRDPFREPLEALRNESRMEFEARRKVPPIVSVDIPSGWDVNQGNVDGSSFNPQVIVSLSAPKVGIRGFTLMPSSAAPSTQEQLKESGKQGRGAILPGKHFLGGRFVPDNVELSFALALPSYPGDSQVVDVTGFDELSEEEARAMMQEESKEAEIGTGLRSKEARGAAPS